MHLFESSISFFPIPFYERRKGEFLDQLKVRLRRKGIEKLKNLAKSGKKKEKEQRIYKQLFASEYWKSAKVIGTTLSNEFELDTQPVIQRAEKEQKKIVVPKTLPKRQMAFYEMDEQSVLVRSSFGVLEPQSEKLYLPEMIDLLIVPGIIYNRAGYRIGFGGGYYDRYLNNFHKKTCSLVFREQLNEQWQPESFDQKIQQLFID